MRILNSFIFPVLSILIVLSCGQVREENKVHDETIRGAFISAHRGGPTGGYPENALETMQSLYEKIPGVMFEIDIRQTRDKKLVLLHDEELLKGTSAQGDIGDLTSDELKSVYLKDLEGKTTSYNPPLLKEVLKWAKGKDVFFSLDVKHRRLFDETIDLVNEIGVKHQVELITYSIEAAEQVYDLDNEIQISASIRNEKELERFLSADIPSKQVSAFTGLSVRDKKFYGKLKEHGFIVTLGVLGNLDRQAARRGNDLYAKWKKLGIDRFATDRPLDVYETIK